ncbi:hypothetical protein PseAD21_01160 [Pseudomonas sp. AD21]|nr:hypothetical protein PseAD21_01160 [Pseudomonas sp. AD21]
MDLQHQVGGADITIGIGDGVAEGFSAIATAVQGFEIGVTGVQGIGVSAIGIQHQGTERSGKCTGGDGAGGHAVSALHIIGQDVAGQGQQGFRGGVGVAVIRRFGHVVDDVDVERAGGAVAIAVAGGHGEMFAEAIGAVTGRVRVIAVEGVAVADNSSRGVVAGDGQGIAQLRGDRLWKSARHAAADHVDAANVQAAQTIRRRDREAAALSQRAGIGRGAVRQIGFVEGQLAPGYCQAAERHQIVHRRRHDWRVVAIVDDDVMALFGKLGNAIETGGREANDRIHPPAYFGQQYKAVAATRLAWYPSRCVWTGSGRFRGFGRIFTGGDGFLDLLDIGQLRFARRQRFRGIDVHRLVGQQLPGHGHAAVAAQGQLMAVLQMNGDGAFCAGDHLIAGKQAVAFDQGAARAVGALRKNLTNDFSDDPDERCHVKFLRCRPPSALVREAAHGSIGLPG